MEAVYRKDFSSEGVIEFELLLTKTRLIQLQLLFDERNWIHVEKRNGCLQNEE
jgi:hypothetical protein